MHKGPKGSDNDTKSRTERPGMKRLGRSKVGARYLITKGEAPVTYLLLFCIVGKVRSRSKIEKPYAGSNIHTPRYIPPHLRPNSQSDSAPLAP